MSGVQLDALLFESGQDLDVDELAQLRDELGGLLDLVEDTVPTPSAGLAALLAAPTPGEPTRSAEISGGTAPVARLAIGGPPRRGSRPRGAVTGAVVLAVATVGATGISAAANSLPAPLQRHVSDLSRTYLPFDFPRPRASLDRGRTEEPPAPLDASDDATHRGRVVRTARAESDATVPTPTRPAATSSRSWKIRPEAGDDTRRPPDTSPSGGTRSAAAGTSPSAASRPGTEREDTQHDRPRPRGADSEGATSGAASDPASDSAPAPASGSPAPRAHQDKPSPVPLAAPRPGRPVPSVPEDVRGKGKGKDQGKDRAPLDTPGATGGPDGADAVDDVVGGLVGGASRSETGD